jgi:membrane-bound serine protease (ClpP class)
LLLLGIGLIILEVLIPSGGLISIFASAALVGSLVVAFMESNTTGFVFLAVIIVCLPISICWAFKILPRTAIGKKTILSPVVETPQERGKAGVSDQKLDGLMGKRGKTITALRPAGIAEIEGQRYSVVAEGEMMESNTEIVVIEIEGNSIVVDQAGRA